MSYGELWEAYVKLLNEVKALRENMTSVHERCNQLLEETRSERRKRKNMESALRQIQHWDMLNPPQPMSDFPWLKTIVDEALKDD